MSWSNEWAKAEAVQPTAPSNPYDAMSEDQLLMAHKKLQEDLSALKEKEMELRKYIVSRAFPNRTEGTNTKELGAGYELKAVVKFNYSLADNKSVEDGLDRISKIGNSGAFIADRLIGWTPKFYVSEYREIQKSADEGSSEAKEMLKVIETFLTINDAAPTLTIKEPKAKK